MAVLQAPALPCALPGLAAAKQFTCLLSSLLRRRYSKILLLRKGLSEFRLTALERMAGTTRLEPRGLCRDRKKVSIGNGQSASLQSFVRHCWRVCRYLRVKLPTSRFLAPNRFLSTAV